MLTKKDEKKIELIVDRKITKRLKPYALKKDMEAGFAMVSKEFDRVNQRIDGIDGKFNQVLTREDAILRELKDFRLETAANSQAIRRHEERRERLETRCPES